MAEIVNQARRRRERGEKALPIQGALPARQRDAVRHWANWRGNHSGPAEQTPRERDQKLINELRESGRVNENELCSYNTPPGLLGQEEKIVQFNAAILDIINNMATTRRILLDYKLKHKSKTIEMKVLEDKLLRWPVEVQQIQGQVAELDGARYLMVPDVLLAPVALIA